MRNIAEQLSESDEAAVQRWEGLDQAELVAEVDAYKASLRVTNESLKALGISPAWEVDHSPLASTREGNHGSGAGEEEDAEQRCRFESLHATCASTSLE